jgi:hypothetical protein
LFLFLKQKLLLKKDIFKFIRADLQCVLAALDVVSDKEHTVLAGAVRIHLVGASNNQTQPNLVEE